MYLLGYDPPDNVWLTPVNPHDNTLDQQMGLAKRLAVPVSFLRANFTQKDGALIEIVSTIPKGMTAH
jgi:hypothetical protein